MPIQPSAKGPEALARHNLRPFKTDYGRQPAIASMIKNERM